jgi:F0F1-type ATP synthase assembly protein I
MAEEPEEAVQAEQPDHAENHSPSRARNRPLGLALTLVVALVVFVGVGLLFHAQAYSSPVGIEVAKVVGTSSVDGVMMSHVTLHFNTYPDASGSVNGVPIHPGGNPSWPSYGPTNQYQVPAHALVTVYVRQYDSGGSLNDPWFDKVRGTVDGSAIINGKTVTSIDPNNVGHTFTVRGTPGTDPNFLVNVPLPAVPGDSQTDNGKYETITFSFISGSKGLYAWNCEFPCGTSIVGFGGPMNAYGYMSGFVHVV